MASEQVKPCPFCGKKASVSLVLPACRWQVECDNCLATTWDCRTKEDALARWNRREDPIEMCEHGVDDGEYCEPCNQAYKSAAAEHERTNT